LGGAGYWVSLLVALPFYVLILELLPKSLFRRFPYRALASFSELLRIADFILSPLLWIGGVIVRRFLPRRDFGNRKVFSAREDFKYFTVESEKTGTLTAAEREMIHNVVDFRSMRAREVMVPIAQVQTVQSSATVDEVLEAGRSHDLDRLPVMERGEIIGLVNVFEMLLDRKGERGEILPHIRRIVKVNAEEPAHRVIRKLRAARITMASVVDARAEAIGIVSSEDLIKRLVSSRKPGVPPQVPPSASGPRRN
jgi:putative hemolysin